MGNSVLVTQELIGKVKERIKERRERKMMVQDNAAYREGYQASVRTDSQPELAQNPYPPNSLSWQSWNQGWNSHYDSTWLNTKPSKS